MRDFFLNNFRWKLVALCLAVVVWFTIKFAPWSGIESGAFGLGDRTTAMKLPVLALISPEDKRAFEITPKEVEVRLRIKVSVLEKMPEKEIHAYVELNGLPDLGQLSQIKEVLLKVPEGVELIKTDPPWVTVEHLAAPDLSITNSPILTP